MYVLVRPDGARYWRMDYRWKGKRRTLALGVYPSVSLSERKGEARSGEETACRRNGPSCATQARQGRVEDSVEQHLSPGLRRVGGEAGARGPLTRDAEKDRLAARICVCRDRRSADRIDQLPQLLTALRRVEARGRYETARRLRSTCGQVFRYAIATGRAERDPSADLRGALTAPKVKHRAAVIDPKAIGALLRAIDGYDGQPITLAALRLAPLLFVRPGELRRAEWSEFDLDGAEWRIPGAKMKMGLPHRVPLSRQALAILRDLHPITGGGRYCFRPCAASHGQCRRTRSTPRCAGSATARTRRPTHGFRSTAAVRLNEMGRWNPDAIERQLAHQEANAVRRAYTHAAEYWDERREMMQAWADQLDQWRTAQKSLPDNSKSNVGGWRNPSQAARVAP